MYPRRACWQRFCDSINSLSGLAFFNTTHWQFSLWDVPATSASSSLATVHWSSQPTPLSWTFLKVIKVKIIGTSLPFFFFIALSESSSRSILANNRLWCLLSAFSKVSFSSKANSSPVFVLSLGFDRACRSQGLVRVGRSHHHCWQRALSLLLGTLSEPPSLNVVTNYHDEGIMEILKRNVEKKRDVVTKGCSVQSYGYDELGTDTSHLL